MINIFVHQPNKRKGNRYPPSCHQGSVFYQDDNNKVNINRTWTLSCVGVGFLGSQQAGRQTVTGSSLIKLWPNNETHPLHGPGSISSSTEI